MNKSIKLKMYNSERSEAGITLVALVVTIVVLLILAGVTITALLGDDGIIKKAQDAANAWNEAVINEQESLDNIADQIANLVNGQVGGGSGGDDTPTIPEGLEIGSTVSYNPSGTYNWQSEYATSYDSSSEYYNTYNVPLNSATGESFNLSSWKVLSIDENTGTVELVPSSSTTGTVHLQGAQGYNNGVKLLNDACNALYGNTTKGISARSINIEDIEKYMTNEAVADAHSYTNSESNTIYGNQLSSAYTSSARIYPVIYAQEKLAVINGIPNGDTGLGLSEQNIPLIERSQGTSTTSYFMGTIQTGTSIQPYQTFWNKDATFMSTAFKNYTKQDSATANYYNLIMPNETSTGYWVASRCVNIRSEFCYFWMYCVKVGTMSSANMFNINHSTNGDSCPLFPVIALSSELIKGNATSGFSVK